MIVGKATKQPRETESYSVIYDDDLNDDEDVTSSSHVIYNERKIVGDADITTDYAAQSTDVFKAFRLNGVLTFTIPVGLPDGSEFYFGNSSTGSESTIQCDDGIDGGSTYLLPVNNSVILKRVNGTWTAVATGESVLVSTPDDHRTRVFFAKGEDKNVYVAEVTAITDEGRRLEDEIRITVKETR